MNDQNSYAKTSIMNTTSSIISQIVVMVIGLVLPRLYIETYGSEVNGLVTSITQFISYFTLVEAGLASAGVSALYGPIASKDTSKINRVLVAIRNFYYKTGTIFSGLIIGLAVIYPLFIKVKGFGYWDILILVIVLGFHGVIDFFTLSKYRALLTADQRYYVIANATTIANLINFVAVLVAIKLHMHITVVRAVALTMYIIRTLIINIYVRYKYKYVDFSTSADEKALNKRWDAMILQLLGLAQTSMPVVILTVFAKELSAVSVYSIYNMVASSIISLLFTVTNGFSASFGNLIAEGKDNEFQEHYKFYEFIFLAVTAVVYACMLVMYIPFVSVYTRGITDCEYIYPLVAVLFAVNGLAYNIKTPAGTLIGSAGVFKETKRGTYIQTIIAVVFCIGLTPFLGIPGLLIGLIASNIYRDIELIIFMNRNIVKIPIRESVKNVVSCLIIFTLGCLCILFVPQSMVSYFSWLKYAMLVGIIICAEAVLVCALFNKKYLMLGFKKIKSVIRRRK